MSENNYCKYNIRFVMVDTTEHSAWNSDYCYQLGRLIIVTPITSAANLVSQLFILKTFHYHY